MTRRPSKWVENTEGKGETACYEQFLPFPQCFQILILQTHENQGLFGKGLRFKDSNTSWNLEIYFIKFLPIHPLSNF